MRNIYGLSVTFEAIYFRLWSHSADTNASLQIQLAFTSSVPFCVIPREFHFIVGSLESLGIRTSMATNNSALTSIVTSYLATNIEILPDANFISAGKLDILFIRCGDTLGFAILF